VYKRQPLTGVFFIAGILAIAGSPPFGLFASEIVILKSAISAGNMATAVLALMSIIIAFSGLSYYMSKISFGPRTRRSISESNYKLPIVIFAAGLGAMSFIGMYIPAWFHSLLLNIADSLGGA
jgi:hydrogenase-4 component F